MEEKQSFVFYRSFRDALAGIGDDERIHIYDAIIDYALDKKEPEGLDPVAGMAFKLIRPQLDANERRRQNGVKNGARGREFGRLGGNPAFKKGRPNPYYAKGRKSEGDGGEEIREETREEASEETSEDISKITPSDGGEGPQDNLRDIPQETCEDNSEDNSEITPKDIAKTSPSRDGGKSRGALGDEGEKICEDISKITPKKISPKNMGKISPEDMGEISPSGVGEGPQDNPQDISEDNPEEICEDIREKTCEGNVAKVSPSREGVRSREGEKASREGGAAGDDGKTSSKGGARLDVASGEAKGVVLDIADNPYAGRDSEKISPKANPETSRKKLAKISPETTSKITPEISSKITPETSATYPSNVNANANANANANERDMSLSGTEQDAVAGDMFQSVPGAAVSESEAAEKKMKKFCDRFKIVRDYTGPLLREVDWGKVAAEYEASEYLATMPRYKSLKWIAYNHLTIEGGCYRPKKTEKRADCVERQRPVEGNPFGDWLSGGDGDKN